MDYATGIDSLFLLLESIPITALLILTRILFPLDSKLANRNVSRILRSKKLAGISGHKWKFVVLVIMSTWGIIEIWAFCSETSTYNLDLCWNGYPNHVVTSTLHLYLISELAFRITITVTSLLLDERRKDQTALLLHHVITLTLLISSLQMKFQRIALVVLFVHNIGDLFLEAVQINRRNGSTKVQLSIFSGMLCVWFTTRMIYFPCFLIPSAIFEAPRIIYKTSIFGTPFFFRLMVIALLALYVLHLYWTVLICRVIQRYVTTGTIEDVTRKSKKRN